jgi:hypothetical protein
MTPSMSVLYRELEPSLPVRLAGALASMGQSTLREIRCLEHLRRGWRLLCARRSRRGRNDGSGGGGGSGLVLQRHHDFPGWLPRDPIATRRPAQLRLRVAPRFAAGSAIRGT